MTVLNVPYFGQIAIDNLEEYYAIDIDFNGNKIQMDLNFKNKSIELSRLDKVKRFIENIERFDK